MVGGDDEELFGGGMGANQIEEVGVGIFVFASEGDKDEMGWRGLRG